MLIGEPGVTYKYLGLRLFALPWSFPGRSPQNDVEEACSILGELNTYFKQMSRKLISEKRKLNSCCTLSCPTTSASSIKYETACVNGDHERLDHKKRPAERTKIETLEKVEESEKAEGTCAIKRSNNQTEGEQLKKFVIEDKASESSSVENDKDDSSGSSKQLSEVVQPKVPSLAPPIPQLTKDSSGSSEQDIGVSKFNVSSIYPQSSEENDVKDSSRSTDSSILAKNGAEVSSGSSEPAVELLQSTPSSLDPSHNSSSSSSALSVEEGTNFNVALLNYMDPNDPNLRLKEEPYYGMGELAVSWHMDTGLIRGSTVAVYNHTETGKHNVVSNKEMF